MSTTTRRAAGTAVALAVLLLLGACAAGPNVAANPGGYGFWWGLWHGAILPVTFIVSLFTDTVSIYEVDNNGTWYDVGFVLGIALFSGPAIRCAADGPDEPVSALGRLRPEHTSRRQRTVRRRRRAGCLARRRTTVADGRSVRTAPPTGASGGPGVGSARRRGAQRPAISVSDSATRARAPGTSE